MIWQSLLFALYFLTVFCSKDIPRLILRQDTSDPRLSYNRNLSHTVFCLQDGSENLFIGGTNFVLQVNVTDSHVLKNFTLGTNNEQSCDESSCENAVTVIEEFQNGLLVCGTNGGHPRCWNLDPRDNNGSTANDMDGIGISSYTCSQISVSLTIDGDLYAAAPLYRDGTSLQFRRKAGIQPSVWMYDQWISEPTFISAFLAKRPEDPINEKIYVLFREKNPDSNPEADPWISRVARVCKVDKGGSKRLFQNIWTSFLKARLVCAIPSESLYFNRLQDVFVLHSENWRESQVYALFSSSWNSTAVCIYSLAELDDIFENSIFKGYSDEIPSPRPGTCVEDSRHLPTRTISVIKHHPEMDDWVHPIQKHSPFYVSDNKYTKIAVDRVQAADEKIYNVLLLATEMGVIHKILVDDSKVFIISETVVCSDSAPVQSMKLNSEKGKLFVGCPSHMSVLDLQTCQNYNTSCQDCVLARDPYCAWTGKGCTSQIKGGIQNIATGATYVCSNNSAPNKVNRTKRDLAFSSPAPFVIAHSVPQGFPYYLSCPIESHHATYVWMHEDESTLCKQTQSECLYLIPAININDYGEYTCKASERDYTKEVKKYHLRRSPTEVKTRSHGFKLTAQKQWLLALLTAVLFTVHQPVYIAVSLLLLVFKTVC